MMHDELNYEECSGTGSMLLTISDNLDTFWLRKERCPGAQGVENFMYLGDDGDVRSEARSCWRQMDNSRRVSPVGTRALSDSYRNRFAALALDRRLRRLHLRLGQQV